MFCAFEGQPSSCGSTDRRKPSTPDPAWGQLFPLFKPLPGARQIFDLTVDLVQTSCGMGVPNYTYAGDRESLNDWARKKGEEGVKRYWEEKNQVSLDGIPTSILRKGG